MINKAALIAKSENVTGRTLKLVKIAALTHDIGHTVQRQNHEEIGCQLVKKELPNFGITTSEIDQICSMIMATKIPQSPQNRLDTIVADADLSYLGTPQFINQSALLFKEMNHFNNKLLIEEWDMIQIDFIGKHHYHTRFCIEHYEALKLRHLLKLKKKYGV
ncbi:MAG: HD domain-containing protein [Flavobacteriales bacterium]|nr:HD domain-containing protein [Flavobacteriales bacterium]